jgi:undecaprenyl pyrophosphate phosphatase UppP
LLRDRSTTQPSTSTYKEKQMDDLKGRLTYNVTFMVSATLCLAVLAMIAAFCFGLYSRQVDDGEIFKLLSPAFQTIIGGFIGLLAGIKLSHDDNNKRKCE